MTPATTMTDPATIRARVRELLGSDGAPQDGRAPAAAPSSAEEAATLLRVAREEGWKVLPAGNGVSAGIRPAHAPLSASGAHDGASEPDLTISTSRMAVLIEHEPADLTVHAGAGLTLGALQKGVANAGQWLALDPPGGEGITLGGIVATGTGGPLRVSHGRPRDQLLGLTMVDGAGRILSLGGRVVKNVAGFDLVRLATGSLGALGLITQVIFRLYPLPEDDRTLVWSRGRAHEAWELGRSLATLPLPVAAAELLAGEKEAPLDDSGVRVLLRLMGSKRAVARMREVLLEKVGLPVRELEGPDSASAARILARDDGAGAVTFRAHALPDGGGAIAAALEGVPLRHLAMHLLEGTFRGTLLPDATVEALAGVGKAARSVGGSLRVLRAQGGIPAEIEEGGEPSAAVARLHAGITRGFDPGGILPGAWREGWR